MTPTTTQRQRTLALMFIRTCPECERVFDLEDDDDNEEFHYGHDCES